MKPDIVITDEYLVREHYACFQAIGIAQRIFDGLPPMSFDEYCKKYPIPTKANNYSMKHLKQDDSFVGKMKRA